MTTERGCPKCIAVAGIVAGLSEDLNARRRTLIGSKCGQRVTDTGPIASVTPSLLRYLERVVAQIRRATDDD